MDHPYYLCLQAALHAPTKKMFKANLRRPKETKLYIKPIFDSHEEFSGIARLAYGKFLEKNTRAATLLLPLNYADDVDTPALQAADMLAYETRKYATNQERSPTQPMRPQLQKLLGLIETVFKLDYNSLKLIIAKQRS
jgi:hypothetical protein